MKIRYIGNFPPPYGGVTIKNKLLFDTLSHNCAVQIVDKHADRCILAQSRRDHRERVLRLLQPSGR